MAMKYTEEMRAFILENYKGILSQELADRFNKQFGTNVKASQMNAYRKNNNLKSGCNTRFVKGQQSWNKNRKMTSEQYEKSKGTMFKKGDMPHNHKPVGTESIRWQGKTHKNKIIYVKVKEPNKWKEKHVLVWEEHYGPIPEGHVLVFLDGNTLNTDINNLTCIDRQTNLYLNRQGLRHEDKELTESGILVAEIMKSVNNRKKGGQNGTINNQTQWCGSDKR